MRGNEDFQEEVFSYISAEKRVPQDHPLRAIRRMTDEALRGLSKKLDSLYAMTGRPSIPPEQLLRGLLLQVLYSVRSERLLMEQMDYNLLFRWFVGLRMDDEVWDVTVFTKNRDRLIEGEIAEGFFQEVLKQARAGMLLSDEHFTVDGTLLEAWANRDSFKEKKDPPAKGTGTRGRKLLRDTHESSTDEEARLYKKSAAGAAKPSYLGHVVTENRNGLIVQACVTQSGQKAEKEAGLTMVAKLPRKKEKGEAREITLGADKGYQDEDFIKGLRGFKVSPHVAEYEPNDKWPNWLTPEERQHAGYEISLKKRKLVENVFGWMKSIAGLRQTKLRGVQRVDWAFQFAAAACNLVRMNKLLPAV
jgi:transposase